MHTSYLLPAAASWFDRLQVVPLVLTLGATLLLPFLVHLLPASGTVPLGARLLPMFYAPLIALFLSRFHVAFIAALCAPLLNAWLVGQPAWPLPGVLVFELAVFVALAFWMGRLRGVRWVSAPLAYLGAKGLAVPGSTTPGHRNIIGVRIPAS